VDNQFVFDAVASNCILVATHRHGCCVLQRCIDYATEEQRCQIVSEIASNALGLVQVSAVHAGSIRQLRRAICIGFRKSKARCTNYRTLYRECMYSICSEVQLQCD
jgi:hypothetical protein